MSPERQLDVNAVVIGKGAAVPAKTILRGAANTVLTQTVVNEEPAFTKVDLGTMVTGDIDLATQVTGVLPIDNGGTGQQVGAITILQFMGPAVPAGTTTFLGVGAIGGEATVQQRVPCSGTVLGMISSSSGPPGAGESYIYTLRVQAGDTALTHTVTTLATGASTGTIAVSNTNRISIKLVTSAAAAVFNHSVMLKMRVES